MYLDIMITIETKKTDNGTEHINDMIHSWSVKNQQQAKAGVGTLIKEKMENINQGMGLTEL